MTLVSNEVYIQQARRRGIHAEDLDDAVEDEFERQASAVNNGDLEEQIPFLREALGEEGLRQLLLGLDKPARRLT